MNLGEKLRQLRQNQNLTQPELAEAMGIEQSYLSKLENGKYVPSGEVFSRILEVFDIELGDLLDHLDQQARRQLRQVPAVARYYDQQRQLVIGNRRRWFIGSAFLFAVGAGLIYAGITQLVVPATIYQYKSHGIVLDGEPKEVFRDWMNDLEMWSLRDNERAVELRAMLFERRDEDFYTTRSYRGHVFNVPVDGGTRTYYLEDDTLVNSWVNKLVASFGVFFALLGAIGFLYERKLSHYQ